MAQAAASTLPAPGLLKSGLGVPVLVLVLLAMLVLPLPPFVLDLFFTFNIALSLVVLLVVVYTQRPLDFAAFPTVLLVTTLLRLALNIASTRVVLLNGHTGPDAAGQVIKAFGEFVVGGNHAVGFVVFMILVIINFVVVTKGAGRVSEVTARFTLDAMPGKQMAIDADLNAGLITQDEAKTRRSEIVREADFYGSMDGASKFIRGDAIAGILVLFVNILGGLAIGTLQHHLAFSEALRNYTLLTIGDGLVAQIPALLLSTAAAIIVTRASSPQDMSRQILNQLFDNPRVLGMTAAIIGVMGLVPGMPNLAFLTLAAAAGGGGDPAAPRRRAHARAPAAPAATPAAGSEPRELSWEDVVPVDSIGLEVGYRLIPLVDKAQGGALMTRIKGVRKKLSQEIGFLVPAVHIRDNLDLAPNVYRIALNGVALAETEVYPDRELAINPGRVFGALPGIATRDPAFGLEAVWLERGSREQAQTLGYTVVDASTVVATHLSHLIKNHAHELLTREDVQQLLNNLSKTAPKLVEDLVPKTLSPAIVHKVLQNLLEERVPIRDMRVIAETLAVHAGKSQDPGALTAAVRIALGRSMLQQINGLASDLPVISLDPALEQLLQQSTQIAGEGGAGFEPGLIDKMRRALVEIAQRQTAAGQPVVVLSAPGLRPWLSRFARQALPEAYVLSYSEIPDDKQVRIVATIGG